MPDQLTATEKNALKWVQFDVMMAQLVERYESGEPVRLENAIHLWRLFK